MAKGHSHLTPLDTFLYVRKTLELLDKQTATAKQIAQLTGISNTAAHRFAHIMIDKRYAVISEFKLPEHGNGRKAEVYKLTNKGREELIQR
jgi:predicted ArsR family transcriptional regulator